MSTSFPGAVDTTTTLPNPSAGSITATVDHAALHTNANDSIRALETKVGIDGSAVTSSIDYKLSQAIGSIATINSSLTTFVTLTGAQTLANKTLTTPVINNFVNANHDHSSATQGGQIGSTGIADGSITKPKIDWSTYGLNVKTAQNPTLINPANGDNSFSGTEITFTLATSGVAFVTIHVGASSTTDFEFQPSIYLDNVLYQKASPSAAAGNANNRATQRSHSVGMPLTAGTHAIRAGAFFSSGTALTISATGTSCTAIVLGNVTA